MVPILPECTPEEPLWLRWLGTEKWRWQCLYEGPGILEQCETRASAERQDTQAGTYRMQGLEQWIGMEERVVTLQKTGGEGSRKFVDRGREDGVKAALWRDEYANMDKLWNWGGELSSRTSQETGLVWEGDTNLPVPISTAGYHIYQKKWLILWVFWREENYNLFGMGQAHVADRCAVCPDWLVAILLYSLSPFFTCWLTASA